MDAHFIHAAIDADHRERQAEPGQYSASVQTNRGDRRFRLGVGDQAGRHPGGSEIAARPHAGRKMLEQPAVALRPRPGCPRRAARLFHAREPLDWRDETPGRRCASTGRELCRTLRADRRNRSEKHGLKPALLEHLPRPIGGGHLHGCAIVERFPFFAVIRSSANPKKLRAIASSQLD